MERARRRCRQEWRDLTERWRRSDLTGVDFARQEGLNPNTFAWWRCELSREGRERPLTLVRVQNPVVPEISEAIEVVLPAGVILRLPHSADLQRSAALVARLLELC